MPVWMTPHADEHASRLHEENDRQTNQGWRPDGVMGHEMKVATEGKLARWLDRSKSQAAET